MLTLCKFGLHFRVDRFGSDCHNDNQLHGSVHREQHYSHMDDLYNGRSGHDLSRRLRSLNATTHMYTKRSMSWFIINLTYFAQQHHQPDPLLTPRVLYL